MVMALTSFIGRTHELAEIAALLADPACRLLTLVGPGGIGKTRLAYQAAANEAAHFSLGVCAVPLAGVNTQDYIIPAIADRLRLPLMSKEDLNRQLLNFLRHKHLLLVLDNFEHLIAGADLLADILSAAPNVKILVTSRERLNLSSEWLIPVNGLPFPEHNIADDVRAYPSVQLFEQGARRVQADYQLNDSILAVIDICKLVQGMPLAIELAASWVRQMTPAQIVTHIESDVDFLAANWRDVPDRHRSIRGLFEHSWWLLSPEEQDVLMNLSVFRGGFELEAAQHVAGASPAILASLEDKSLIRGSPARRYDLHELIRQYAASHLADSGQDTEICNRHLDYFLTLAEAADKQLHGPRQVVSVQRIKSEYNNLRTALGWAFEGGDAEEGLRLANALWFYWFRWGGNWAEGFKWYELGLSLTEGTTVVRADAYANGGVLAAQVGKLRAALEYSQQGFEYSQKLDLKHGIARYNMGMSFSLQDYAETAAQLESAVSMLRESGPRWMLGTALLLYGDRARVQGDLIRAQALYQEGLQIAQADEDPVQIMVQRARLGRLAALRGEYAKAQRAYQEAVEIGQQVDSRLGMIEFLVPMGGLAIKQGDYESAERLLKESLEWGVELSNIGTILHATYFLADLALQRQELANAVRLLSDSLNMTPGDPAWQEIFTNHEFNTERLFIAGKLACALGDYAEAAWLLSAGEAVREQSRYFLDPLARTEYEQAVQKAREQLGDEAFNSAWREGQMLAGEEALRRAIVYLESKAAERKSGA